MGHESAEEAPKLYGDLAGWFHLLTAPEEYAEEAEVYRNLIDAASQGPVRTLLELGSGGGNNASHLKGHYALTLSDVSEAMLEMSRSINPECEHLMGDMRTLRLEREFDAVLVHDAIDYMTTEKDLGAAIATAAAHCRTEGVVLLIPDHITETFEEGADHGGHDDESGRGIRYLGWTWDPDPSDSTYITDYAYLLREPDGTVTAEHDRHICGLFSAATWLDLMESAGLEPRHKQVDVGEPRAVDTFIGVKRSP